MVKNKIYLDTNIVADIIEPSRNNHLISLKFIQELVMRDYEIHISEDMLSTLYYISKHKQHTLEFFMNVVFVDWHVLSFGKKVREDATRIALENSLDLEDVLQCLCAKENGCNILVTHDKKFYRCDMEIMTMSEFLEVPLKC